MVRKLYGLIVCYPTVHEEQKYTMLNGYAILSLSLSYLSLYQSDLFDAIQTIHFTIFFNCHLYLLYIIVSDK